MGNRSTKNSICPLCSVIHPGKKTQLCNQCSFVRDYCVKYGRENLRLIVNTSLSSKNENTTDNNSPRLSRRATSYNLCDREVVLTSSNSKSVPTCPPSY